MSATDNRTDAERAYDDARNLNAEAERAYERNPVGAILLRRKAAEAMAEWERTYPAEAAEKIAEQASRVAARDAEIQSRPGYRAALKGRD